MKKSRIIVSFIIVLGLLTAGSALGRNCLDCSSDKPTTSSLSAVDIPAYAIVSHRVGKVELGVTNYGILGTGWLLGGGTHFFTGEPVASCEYPKDSQVDYLFAASFWIGAVVGRDTVVSTGADGWMDGNEFRPAYEGLGDMIYRSIRFPERPDVFDSAISEEDYIAVYSDTAAYLDDRSWDGTAHRPLNIEVTQRSYAWSYSYAEDFILFDYEIKNIGNTTLEKVYMGFYNDSDVGHPSVPEEYTDDICGFRETFPVTANGCEFEDTVNIAWISDNDGDPDGIFNDQSCPNVTGMRIVRTPADNLNVSFNWWISNGDASRDFGPRELGNVGSLPEEFRDFETGGLGTPEGDKNKYYILRNQEFDSDQIYSATITSTDTLWSTPPQDDIKDLSNGFDTRYLLSFGPFDIEPGERLPISFAFVAGENFHRSTTNINYLDENNYYPDMFYDNLDFEDLALNSTWASRVYDNPGRDSNDDGYAGKVRVCNTADGTDTSLYSINEVSSLTWYDPATCVITYYEGDGVPDFRGASPPPSPYVWVEPSVGSLNVRFNGQLSENTEDVFSGVVDFEGYRVYVGRDEREASYSMVASYDIEDYNQWVYDTTRVPDPGYVLNDPPYTLDSLKALYGESFNPLDYPQSNPFAYNVDEFTTEIYYFDPQDYNASELGVTTSIVKVYPDQPYPSSLISEDANPDELTEEGYLKYFEYETVIGDLLPSVEWWVSVTAFDFGSPETGLAALEGSKTTSAVPAYPLSAIEVIDPNNLDVFVYPNPYRVDAGYRTVGFEGRIDTDRPNDRVREIHFANLPAKCMIRIYSLDGDLVREIPHDKTSSDTGASHETWDMITRNTQMVVSGMYYWTVEAEGGETQVGKLVVIM